MYRKVLLAYDGSSRSNVALRQAVKLAEACKAELHLLGIVKNTGGLAIAQAAGPIDVWGLEQQYLRKALEGAMKGLGSDNVTVNACIREGEAAAEIARHARSIKADLVVLGHEDRSVLTGWFTGTTATTLLKELPCSLLIATE
jgi:nucleotide-binding universal stress UspA family protein